MSRGTDGNVLWLKEIDKGCRSLCVFPPNFFVKLAKISIWKRFVRDFGFTPYILGDMLYKT